MDNQAALLNDADTPAFGPENAKVAVIEFLGSAWKTENILR